MVDVTAKPVTQRRAVAAARVHMQPETLARIQQRDLAKGDVLQVARLAGIQAAKHTPQLIPLCHVVPLTAVTVDCTCDPTAATVEIRATVTAEYRTGVEMEALTAAAVTALTIYDMCKSIDRGLTIDGLHLLEKTGGRSDYERR